jgi:alanine-glyoxylate transaminase/serine-glyoxylate transaminase/serine-pyruvate transaminase
MVLEEGLNERFNRHARIASAFRAGVKAIGLRLLCDDAVASNTLTVAYYPTGVLQNFENQCKKSSAS